MAASWAAEGQRLTKEMSVAQDAVRQSSRARYGTQTALSLKHFSGHGRRFGDVPAFVRNYARIKQAAAMANRALGVLDSQRAQAIITACSEIVAGEHAEQFPTGLVLGGGGTTTNMNINEVIADRAAEIAGIDVHPNDHVNASQSTNDTFPSAMALTIMDAAQAPLAAARELAVELERSAQKHGETRYLGRTCLQDAVSVAAGATMRGQARAVRRGAEQLAHAVGELADLPLGATVLGTSIGAPEGFAQECIAALGELTGTEVREAEDLFDAMAHFDPYAAIADAGSRLAVTIAKIGGDLRLRSSGPHGGFAEVTLPALQAGSSIMPGKVNPVVPEYAMQLSYRVRGRAHTVRCAVAAGELELNVMEPIILDSLLDICDDVRAMADAMATLCIAGLKWDGERRVENLSRALDSWVQLSTERGYDQATRALRARDVADD